MDAKRFCCFVICLIVVILLNPASAEVTFSPGGIAVAVDENGLETILTLTNHGENEVGFFGTLKLVKLIVKLIFL